MILVLLGLVSIKSLELLEMSNDRRHLIERAKRPLTAKFTWLDIITHNKKQGKQSSLISQNYN